jgi:hypothetical protein
VRGGNRLKSIKARKFLPYPIVEVTWVDPDCAEGWQNPEEIERLLHDEHLTDCVSVGYKIAQDERRIALAMSKTVEGDLDNLLTLPMTAVRNIRVLRK